MAKRGLYKQGHYLALLYALDTHYELELLRRGESPARWQPQPRNRVGQFLDLITTSLLSVGVTIPETYSNLLETLKSEGLQHIARMLEHVTVRHIQKLPEHLKPKLEEVSLIELQAQLHVPSATTERHPQARKLSQTVTHKLDDLWLQTVKELEQEQRGKWPSVSVILGSLPPDFGLIQRQVIRGLTVSGEGELSELSVLHFYSLATGTFPRPSQTWETPLKWLEPFAEKDVSLLKSLSKQQAEQLSGLSREAFYLVLSLRSIRQATNAWRSIIEKIYHLDDSRASQRLLTRWRRVYRLDIRQLGAIRDLLRGQTWQQVKVLDEELIRLIDMGELNLSLFFSLQAWDKDVWAQVQKILQDDWVWVTSYREDERLARALWRLRTPARLELSTLFPRTIAWLDSLAEKNLESLLLRELDTVADYAKDYAQLVKKALQQKANAL